jgi:hypothetical protein
LFIILILIINRDNEIPSLYRQNIIDSLYLYYNISKESIKEEFKRHIELKGKFSFTLDAWTASNQTEYLGITV